MLFPLVTLLATAALCSLAAVLPAKLRGGAPQKATRRDALCALALFFGTWLFALCAYHRPGLLVGFDAFRCLAVTAVCGWAGVCATGLRLLRGAKKVLPLLAVAALGAELLVFNLPYFNTHSYQPFQLLTCLDPGINAQLADGRLTLDEEHSYLRFVGINQPLYNLSLDDLRGEATDLLQKNSTFTLQISAVDRANSALTDMGFWQAAEQAPRSAVISLDLTGEVSTLVLQGTGYSDVDSTKPLHISVSGITANARRPLLLSPLRCLAFFLLLAAGYAVRPRSALWRRAWLEKALPERIAAGVLTAVLAVCVAVVPFMAPANSGLATETYNTAFWDGKSTVNFVYEQYGALAHSLLNGRLDLPTDPPPELTALENPYDVSARTAADVHGVLWDHAFYNGRYYVYFGIVPCLLFQLPFEAVTGIQNLSYALCMVVLGWLFLLGVFGMLGQAVRRWFPKTASAAFLLAFVGIVAGSGLYSLLVRPYIYEYAILAGAAFLVLGLWQWLAAANTAPERRGALLAHLVFGSLCVALVAGCRPQMELYALLALPIFWQRYVTEKRLATKAGAGEAAAFLLPVLLVAAGLMAYNAARFGSPFDFGANYNLTGNDMTQRGWNPVRIAPALFTGLFDLPRLQAVFPYLVETDLQTNAVIRTISEKFLGGTFGMLPFAWAAVLPLTRRGRKTLARPGLRGVTLTALAAMVVIAVVDCEMAGVLQRYQMDYTPVLLFAAALCWFAVCRTLAGYRAQGAALAGSLARLTRLGMAGSVACAVCYRFCTLFAAGPALRGMNAGLYYQTSRLIQFWM